MFYYERQSTNYYDDVAPGWPNPILTDSEVGLTVVKQPPPNLFLFYPLSSNEKRNVEEYFTIVVIPSTGAFNPRTEPTERTPLLRASRGARALPVRETRAPREEKENKNEAYGTVESPTEIRNLEEERQKYRKKRTIASPTERRKNDHGTTRKWEGVGVNLQRWSLKGGETGLFFHNFLFLIFTIVMVYTKFSSKPWNT